jgi:hypothetical protein
MNARDLTDWLWPTLEPETPGYRARISARVEAEVAEQHAACKTTEQAREWLDHEINQYQDEQKRGEHVRGQLVPMLGVGSIISAVALGIFGWLASEKLDRLTRRSVIFFLAIGLYALCQLAGVILSAKRGLAPRAYQPLPHPPALADEAIELYHRRKAAAVRRATAFNAEQTNEMISCKKIALTCWRNFGIVVLLVIVAAILGASGRSPPP